MGSLAKRKGNIRNAITPMSEVKTAESRGALSKTPVSVLIHWIMIVCCSGGVCRHGHDVAGGTSQTSVATQRVGMQWASVLTRSILTAVVMIVCQ